MSLLPGRRSEREAEGDAQTNHEESDEMTMHTYTRDTGTDLGPVPTAAEQGFVACDPQELKRQIGMWNILAVSGGRVVIRETGITLPCRYGYTVTVDLAAGDTYTVRRLFTKAGRTWTHGEMSGVYCDQIGEVTYRAGMFRDKWPL